MGNKHGKGKYIWQDGSSYEGQFENDVVQGEGVLKDTDGGVYSGQFFDNMQHVSNAIMSGSGRIQLVMLFLDSKSICVA